MALGSLFAGTMARADIATGTPVHISYTVPLGCPGEAAFLDMVASDGTAIAPAPADEPAQSFEITVEGATPMTGRLRLRGVDGEASERMITGPHCDEVIRSLAVIVALAVPPATAPIVSKPTNSGTEAATEGGPSAALSPESEASAPSPAPWPAPAEPEGGPDEARRRAERLRPRWRAAVSVETGGGAGPLPILGWTLGFYGEAMRETPDVFAPSLRIGVERTLFSTRSQGFDHLEKMVARVEACPWRGMASQPWSDDAFSAQLCARFDVGWVDAAASPGAPDVRQVWAATGALLRIRWLFPDWFLEAEGGIDLPITRYRFSSGDGFDLEMPQVVGMFGIGGGALFL
jgi:hypothetical protein